MNKKVIARPCKEQGNWEIQDPNGNVMQKHYYTKEACVTAASNLANEFGCELQVEDNSKNNTANQTNKMANNQTNNNNTN